MTVANLSCDSIDIAQLRANGRCRDFCHNVTPAYLTKVADFLILNKSKISLADQDDIIATIGNIMLINRTLDNRDIKEGLLNFLNESCRVHIRSFTDSCFDFDHLVPVYRLYFLLVVGDNSMVNRNVWNNTLDILHDSFRALRLVCEEKMPDLKYKALVAELLKALLNIYAPNPLVIPNGFRKELIKAHILPVAKDLELCDPIMHNLLSILMISFSHTPIHISEMKQNAEQYTEFLMTLIELLRRTSDISLSENIVGAISIYAFLVEILQVLIVSSSKDPIGNQIHLLMREKMLPYKDPCLFQQNMAFLANNFYEPQLYSYSTSLASLRQLMLKLYYWICFRGSVKCNDTQVLEYIDLFGYVLAKPTLDKEGITPSTKLQSSLQPNKKYLNVQITFDQSDTAITSMFEAALHARNNIEQVDEMTLEEKESEAEKLFVLFDRMEKLGTFKNLRNPVRDFH